MHKLQWSDALSLDMPGMDDGRKTLVHLLGLAHDAHDPFFLQRWRDLVQHTALVFAQEDRWMHATQFSSSRIHCTQHQVVLQVMQEGLRAGESGNLDLIQNMVAELGQWFANHAQSMDAALALHLRRVGYDPQTGVLSMPDDLGLYAGARACVQA